MNNGDGFIEKNENLEISFNKDKNTVAIENLNKNISANPFDAKSSKQNKKYIFNSPDDSLLNEEYLKNNNMNKSVISNNNNIDYNDLINNNQQNDKNNSNHYNYINVKQLK